MPGSQSANRFVTEFSQKRDELSSAINKEKMGQQPNKEEVEVKKEINIDEHKMDFDAICQKHGTDLTRGLTSAQVEDKVKIFGKNKLTPPPTTPLWKIFIEHLTGFFSLLLWAAAILCFIAYGLKSAEVENLYLGIVLSIVTLLTGIFSFWQDYQSAEVMAGFASFLPPETSVIRDGEEINIASEDIVPGDLVKVKAGNKIPADFRVTVASSFKVNNSSLTGESLPQKRGADVETKHENPLEASNLAFYGTLCEAGSATGIVVATADNTVIGAIANLAATTDNVQTPIAQEIEHFITIISSVAIFLGITFLIIGFGMGVEPVANLVFAIGIIVANVPEGLLATVTVSLTLTAKRMAKKQVLVKNLEAVETLGSTTCIASDKTGTLTQNIMTVVHVFYDGNVKLASGDGNGAGASFDKGDAAFNQLRMVATLCNNATFEASVDNMAKDIQQRDCNGDASESALIKFCERIDGIAEVRDKNKKLAEIPFNSANKYQVSIHMQQNNPTLPRLLVMKGAPERIINRCDSMLLNGRAEPMTSEIVAGIDSGMASFMANGERVLGFAFCELDPSKYGDDYEYNIEDPNFPLEKGEGLIFAGLMSLMDPPRSAVPGAVLSCQKAGIKVIMVTGDHPDTAAAIARNVNIIRDKSRKEIAAERKCTVDDVAWDDKSIQAIVVTGGELLDMSDERLDAVLDFDQIVFARTSPAQKLRIVQGLQNKTTVRRGFPVDAPKLIEHVVAVTGDGVNDSPALKAANIGVAMGIVGSDVAKDAADMILLNDNFASIVDGVEEGRLIFDNLKKSIAYTLSSNIPEISPFLVFILIQIPLPLPTVLILCIDLGTDMIPAISLAYEFKEANIMKKPPRDMRCDRLVTAKLINFSYLQIGVVQAAAGFYTYVVVLNSYGFTPEYLMGRAQWFFPAALTRTHDCMSAYNYTDIRKELATGSERELRIVRHTELTTHGKDQCMSFFGLDGDIADGEQIETIPLGSCYFDSDAYASRDVCWNAKEALRFAQCSFFIAIIVVQWADLVICKTRTLSIFTQGMRNGTLNFGLFFTTILGSALCYIPGMGAVLGTAPLEFVHWCPAMPFCLVIFMYDETRKYIIRSRPTGWVYKNTYY